MRTENRPNASFLLHPRPQRFASACCKIGVDDSTEGPQTHRRRLCPLSDGSPLGGRVSPVADTTPDLHGLPARLGQPKTGAYVKPSLTPRMVTNVKGPSLS